MKKNVWEPQEKHERRERPQSLLEGAEDRFSGKRNYWKVSDLPPKTERPSERIEGADERFAYTKNEKKSAETQSVIKQLEGKTANGDMILPILHGSSGKQTVIKSNQHKEMPSAEIWEKSYGVKHRDNPPNLYQKTTMDEKKGATEVILESQQRCSSKQQSMSIADYAEHIMNKITMIVIDEQLYYYTGRSYRRVRNDNDFLRLIRKYVDSKLFFCRSTKIFADVRRFLLADEQLIPRKIEKKIWNSCYLMSFRNGILDIRNLELHEHSSKYLTFYELEFDWKHSREAPCFTEYLEQVSLGDETIKRRIIEAMGYLLSPVNNGKYFFVMGMAPNSGKSTLALLLQYLIGEQYIAHISPAQMNNRFAFGDIGGKLINASLDLPKGKITAYTASIMKQITGGDVITIEQKYEPLKSEKSSMRFLFASNHPVTLSKQDDDEAFWQRMIVIPFRHEIPKSDADTELLSRLCDEKEAVTYLCLTAFHEVYQNDYIFSPCPAADQMKASWRNGDDEVSQCIQEFFAECMDVTGEKTDIIGLYDLYCNYSDFCANYDYETASYARFKAWCDDNLPGCKHDRKRIDGGTNAVSVFTGLKYHS